MKVLNVSTWLDPVSGGGSAERTFQVSRFLVRAGAECEVLTLDLDSTSDRAKDLPRVRVVALPCLGRRYYIPKFSFKQVRNIVRSADIVHLISHWTFINTLGYFMARRLGRPYVVCPAGALPIYGRSKWLKHTYNWLVGKRIIQNADGHVAITAEEIPQFEAYGVSADKVTVIPNGINPEDYSASDGANFRRKFGLSDQPFIFFVGRLNPIKGPDLLMRAFCQARDELAGYHLIFAGPDEGILPELQMLATEFGVEDRVHFLGYLGGVAKSQAYQASELLVVPSRHEAMSIVALEDGITGTPVLITDQCGFDQVARVDGGRVVPASVEGLQTGLVEMLEDPVGLKQMGKNLQQFLREQYTWDSVVREYLALYDRILGKVA